MDSQFGIVNLKKAVKFACDFTAQCATALSDGKFAWTESFGFVDELAQVPAVIKSLPSIKQELSELSTDERNELYEYLKENFDIPNDAVETLVENSLAFTIAAIGLFEQWKTLKK